MLDIVPLLSEYAFSLLPKQQSTSKDECLLLTSSIMRFHVYISYFVLYTYLLRVVVPYVYVCVRICFCPGASQDCFRNLTLVNNRNMAAIDINTTTTFCFIAPVTPIVRCQLNGAKLTNFPPSIVFREPFVIIYDWTAVEVDNRAINILNCELGRPAHQETHYANFYSLSKF